MYLSSMNENVSRNTPAYVFEIQQVFLQQSLPVGTEYAMVAVADGLTKGTALRTTLGRVLRAIIHRESGRINAMELLSLILTASASPVEPLPSDRIERAMHETLGFILEVRQHLEDPDEVNLGAGMMRGSKRLRSWPEPLISRSSLEKFSFSGSRRVVLVVALCGLCIASLVVGLSRRRNEAGENVAIQRSALPTAESESRPGSVAPDVGASQGKWQVPEKGMLRSKAGVQRSGGYEAQKTHPSYIAPPVAVRTPPLPIGESRTNLASASTNSVMPSASTTDRKKVLSGPVRPRTGAAADVSTATVGPAISVSRPKPVASPHGLVQSGSAGIMAANLISSPTPAYPAAASDARVEGEVTINALVGKDGNVLHATVVSGPPLLREAALKAVEQWQYRPYLVSGKPAVMATTAIVEFALAHD